MVLLSRVGCLQVDITRSLLGHDVSPARGVPVGLEPEPGAARDGPSARGRRPTSGKATPSPASGPLLPPELARAFDEALDGPILRSRWYSLGCAWLQGEGQDPCQYFLPSGQDSVAKPGTHWSLAERDPTRTWFLLWCRRGALEAQGQTSRCKIFLSRECLQS
jgi:hypothetical protein